MADKKNRGYFGSTEPQARKILEKITPKKKKKKKAKTIKVASLPKGVKPYRKTKSQGDAEKAAIRKRIAAKVKGAKLKTGAGGGKGRLQKAGKAK